MKKIPLCIPSINHKEVDAASRVIKSGWMTHGPQNKVFEKKFADFIGVKHAISMNSCTSALFLALIANNIKGEVILPSFSFVASANAVITAGATPVFADINYSDRCLNSEHVESLITKKTEAIMVVHFAGQCANMEALQKIAKKYKLLLIEDSAETIGGTFNGKLAGSFGIGCFSFFPTKNIAIGEGGMLTTNNDKIASKVKILMAHGIDSSTYQREKLQKPWFRSAIVAGYNFRLSNILAAIGVEQIKKINKFNELRKKKSELLTKKLSKIEWITTPEELPNRKHVYQMYTIILNKKINRERFVNYLNSEGVGASVHFEPAIHEQKFYKNKYRNTNLEVTEDLVKRIVTLPMYPDLKNNDIEYMIKKIKNFSNEK